MTAIERVKGVFDPRWTADGVTADTFDIGLLMKASRMSCQDTVGTERRRAEKRREKRRKEGEKGGEERQE